MLVSYVAGEGVELAVHKESVVVEEIKEVELRSRRTQFIYDRNYNRIGLKPRGHVPSRLPVKKLRGLLHKRRKVRLFVWNGIRNNIISYYSSGFTINPQLRRRSVRSHSVLFKEWSWTSCLLIYTVNHMQKKKKKKNLRIDCAELVNVFIPYWNLKEYCDDPRLSWTCRLFSQGLQASCS